MQRNTHLPIAVIGGGMAGSAVASALWQAGRAVHLFDKARGPGGRLATRRLEWVDRQGHGNSTRLDHGAPGFEATSAAFQSFADRGLAAGWLAEWTPALAAGSVPIEGGPSMYVPVPDTPALCRQLLDGVPATWAFAVDAVHKSPQGWQVQCGAVNHDLLFDAVVLALPPAQAAPLLSPHRLDWARHASVAPMQPCWTLMGVAADADTAPGWNLARPPAGPLGWVLRNDLRPGRLQVAGQSHWVAHAKTGWSRRHLEQSAAWVQQQMQAALATCLGRPVDWLHCTVHRWRYALPQPHATAPTASFWWDAEQGLGVCGDFLGGCGVEGAWLSAQALSAALLLLPASEADSVGAAPPVAGGSEGHTHRPAPPLHGGQEGLDTVPAREDLR